MKNFFFLLAILSILGFSTIATAKKIHLDFDDLVVGNQLTDQYHDMGVVFSGTYNSGVTGGYIGTEDEPGSGGTKFFGNSEPNFIIVGIATLTANFINPETDVPDTVSKLSVRVGDGDLECEDMGINAFDIDGDLIYSSIVHLYEEGTTITIDANSIAKVTFFSVPIWYDDIGGYSGFAIDDFAYSK